MFPHNRPRAECSGCGQALPLCQNGTIYQHGKWEFDPMVNGKVSSYCPGAGKPPGEYGERKEPAFQFPPVKGVW